MSEVHFSIIIVNYNTRDLLKACLDSIYGSKGNAVYEIIVSDNNSSDGSIEMLRNDFNDVVVIENEDNLGFAKACNRGIRVSRGKFIILLNSDTEVFPDTLDKVKNYFYDERNDRRAGILGCRILNSDGSLQYSAGRFPTLWSTVLDMFRPYHKRKYLLTGYDAVREVDWITGAFLAIDRDVINDIGELDEHYFMYYEEVDWCLRAKKRGWKVVYSPLPSITHKSPMAAKKDSLSLKVLAETRRSHLYYYRKNHSYLSFLSLTLATMISLSFMLLKLHLTLDEDKEIQTERQSNIKSVLLVVWQTFLDLNKQRITP